ncbi:hypothetical protein X949_5769 [Burkholderia pseudomallei MSHR5609]|nr:hypothetical protein X949_5769 [Burkholderia pseudomallei MSHR5609]
MRSGGFDHVAETADDRATLRHHGAGRRLGACAIAAPRERSRTAVKPRRKAMQ